MARHVHDDQIGYALTAAGIGPRRRTVGHPALRGAEPAEHRTGFFDPVLNHPDEVALLPARVQRLRESAYTGSRRGRGTEDRDTGHAVTTSH